MKSMKTELAPLTMQCYERNVALIVRMNCSTGLSMTVHCIFQRKFISEMPGKAAVKGEDKPFKQNDHSMDAQRYALYTHFFNKPSKSMTEAEALAMERAYVSRVN